MKYNDENNNSGRDDDGDAYRDDGDVNDLDDVHINENVLNLMIMMILIDFYEILLI